MKTALITGITGQDGSYLAELLVAKGYRVVGLVRNLAAVNYENLASVRQQIELVEGDLGDQATLVSAVESCEPDEVYNLAAQSYVDFSFTEPLLTGEITAMGAARLLEAIRMVNPKIRFYQASSSEMFGLARESPQTETTPLQPRSPYAIAKVYAHWMSVLYRESYGMFTCCGILFNHDSPRRPARYVTRKVSQGVAKIKLGLASSLSLGNLEARRDWGFAGDYVRAMWAMLQQDRPGDYVVATGVAHFVREVLDVAFSHAGLKWHDFVKIDPANFRPVDALLVVGDASRAHRELGWRPETDFATLIRNMVDYDLELLAGTAPRLIEQRRGGPG